MSITFDQSTFNAGLRRKLALTKKTEAEVLNHASRNVCLRAIQFTPAADKDAIQAQLASNGLVFKLLQSPAFQDRLPRKLAGKAFAKRSRAELIADAKTLIALRKRSIKNIAAGWIKAAQAFGGGKNRKVSDKGNTGKGYGKRAKENALEASGVNAANGAPKIGAKPLQEALNFVGKDMLTYMPKKIVKVWNS